MFTKIDIENVDIHDLYLINSIDYEEKTETPFFIAIDQTFAINYFESWKRENNEENKLCKIIKLPFITEKKELKNEN